MVIFVKIEHWNYLEIDFIGLVCRMKLYPTYIVVHDIKKKSKQDVAPLANTETTQSLELVCVDYLQIEPSKGNTENVLTVADHSQGMDIHFLLNVKEQ